MQPFLLFAPPGHYYSPIPKLSAIRADADRIFGRPEALPGIDVRREEQLVLLERLAVLLEDWEFPEAPDGEHRYFTGEANYGYGVGDAATLHAMLRDLRPARVIEVGSGFSSCMILDTDERFLSSGTQLTFIEPFSSHLRSLVRPGDLERDNVRLIEDRLQDVDLAVFKGLERGDVLFVDSTHVAKVGSDVMHLFNDVLPVLAPGVVIHLHDVFWPFEYPHEWVEGGRAWNESYLLRAFLAYNAEFEILLFNDYLPRNGAQTRTVPPPSHGPEPRRRALDAEALTTARVRSRTPHCHLKR